MSAEPEIAAFVHPAVLALMERLAGERGKLIDLTGARHTGPLRSDDFGRAFAAAILDGVEWGQRFCLFAANSFARRAWGRTVVEALGRLDLTHAIDLGGCYIPGHGTPTLLVVGRNAPPLASFVRLVTCRRGEPRKPERVEDGFVWRSVVNQLALHQHGGPPHDDGWTEAINADRCNVAVHPWRWLEPRAA